MKLFQARRTIWLTLLVLLCGLWGASGPIRMLPVEQGQDLRSLDADTHYFYYAWEENPHFTDTLKWWYGPWGQKFRPFYRPIPSLLFWTQYKTFGINSLFQFHLILLLWHFAALLFIWRFLVDLLGERDGTLAACLWGASVGDYLFWMAPLYALDAWKDNVESWHALAFTACIWAFLRFLKTENRRWQVAAFFLFWLALCVKEMAYMAPFVMLLLCWHEKKLREKWQSVSPFFCLAGCMFFFRLWALQGMGFRMKGNGAWKMRLFSENLGGPFTRPLNGDCLMLSVVFFILGLWWLSHRTKAPKEQQKKIVFTALAAFAGALLLQFYTSYTTDLSLSETLSRFLVEGEWSYLPALSMMLFFWWRFFKNKNRNQLFGVLFALIVYAPLTSGANTAHIYYFPSVGWSIWLAYAVLDFGALARDFWNQKALPFIKPKGAETAT